MTDNFQTRGQYRAAAESVAELLDDIEAIETQHDKWAVEVSAQVCIALSNLAVAEAIHRVAAVLEKGTPVAINTTGTIDLNPTSVAQAWRQIRDEGA